MTVAVSAADLAARLARHAPDHAIDLAGAVPLTGPAPHARQWLEWLDAGLHGGLEYLERTRVERTDPRLRNPEATTLLVFAQRYDDGFPADSGGDWLAGVARYARGDDYHDLLLRAVKALLSDLRAAWPGLVAYPATDTGPYLERDWAAAAGLGFVGRNTCLIHESLGSALVLAVAPSNLDVDGWDDAPHPLYAVAPRGRLPAPDTDRCGTCTRCLDACPTGAITAPRRLDARRCLSTWTIEWRGRAPADQRQRQGDHLFGCDVCQEVCPWNGRAARQATRRPEPLAAYRPLAAHEDLDLADLMVMDTATFGERFRRTPLWRQHPAGLRRNALVVAANTGRRELLGLVRRVALEDEDAEVRDVAAWAAARLEEQIMKIPEAAYWQARDDGAVACLLCPTACVLREGRSGPCGTRANRQGRMVPLHYGQLVAAGLDPMEKKPLYHYLPGASILSVAAAGCNLHCAFCQNWRLSQEASPLAEVMSPAEVVDLARRHRSVGIAYTYSEPLVWFEFVRDTARLAREAGLVNVIVSNGYLNPKPLAELIPWIDAANIDLKSMDERFYRDICKAHLQPVLASLAALHAAGVHLEVTNLVIPGHNDRDQQLDRLRDHVADLSPLIPLHLSAYHPAWCFDAPATPPATLARAAERCAERLSFVYTGNVNLPRWNDTRCPSCGRVVIERQGGGVRCDLVGSRCPGCDSELPLVI